MPAKPLSRNHGGSRPFEGAGKASTPQLSFPTVRVSFMENSEEFVARCSSEFTKADDPLQGYLAIVKNPDHYHNAQQRLADAHLKLEAIAVACRA